MKTYALASGKSLLVLGFFMLGLRPSLESMYDLVEHRLIPLPGGKSAPREPSPIGLCMRLWMLRGGVPREHACSTLGGFF